LNVFLARQHAEIQTNVEIAALKSENSTDLKSKARIRRLCFGIAQPMDKGKNLICGRQNADEAFCLIYLPRGEIAPVGEGSLKKNA
jgi:hypothetical protein